jgi:hypothetical protein
MSIKKSLRRERERFTRAVRALDGQTVFVLVACIVLMIVQETLGSHRFFRAELASSFAEEHRALLSWAWWFGIQGLTGFVLPVLSLVVLFRRRPAEIGLGRGDARLASILALLYLPFVAAGTWVLSDDPAFQAMYPHLQEAAYDWRVFLVYEALFLFYWLGWEYLWRGFVLFGTARTFGLYAIFIQTIPFALLHLDKPLAEALLSIAGGLALGALVWRCRSFWIAVPIHAAQMLILDFWCTLRLRTAVTGVGPGALWQMLENLGS